MYTLCYVPVDQVKSYYDEVIIPQVQEGVDHDQEWEDYDKEIDRFGYYYSQTWIEKRGGRRALFSDFFLQTAISHNLLCLLSISNLLRLRLLSL